MSTEQMSINAVAAPVQTSTNVPTQSVFIIALVVLGVVGISMALLGVISGIYWITIAAGLATAIGSVALVFNTQLQD